MYQIGTSKYEKEKMKVTNVRKRPNTEVCCSLVQHRAGPDICSVPKPMSGIYLKTAIVAHYVFLMREKIDIFS